MAADVLFPSADAVDGIHELKCGFLCCSAHEASLRSRHLSRACTEKKLDEVAAAKLNWEEQGTVQGFWVRHELRVDVWSGSEEKFNTRYDRNAAARKECITQRSPILALRVHIGSRGDEQFDATQMMTMCCVVERSSAELSVASSWISPSF